MGRLAASTAGLACLLVAAPAAMAKTTTQTASADGVSAALTFTGTGLTTKGLALQITRASAGSYGKAVVVYRHAVTDPACGTLCAPFSTVSRSNQGSVRVVALDGGGQPQVVVSLWTGGASCCEVDQVFSYSPATNTYTSADYDFGDYGAKVRDLGHNGRYEFVTGDAAFKYEFTDGAASGEPVKVMRFVAGRFVNVTHSYPKLIAADAAGWLKLYKRSGGYTDSVGIIAAWAADEDSLGHAKQVSSYLQAQAKLGHLTNALNPKEVGVTFIADLDRFLRKHGYLT